MGLATCGEQSTRFVCLLSACQAPTFGYRKPRLPKSFFLTHKAGSNDCRALALKDIRHRLAWDKYRGEPIHLLYTTNSDALYRNGHVTNMLAHRGFLRGTKRHSSRVAKCPHLLVVHDCKTFSSHHATHSASSEMAVCLQAHNACGTAFVPPVRLKKALSLTLACDHTQVCMLCQ